MFSQIEIVGILGAGRMQKDLKSQRELLKWDLSEGIWRLSSKMFSTFSHGVWGANLVSWCFRRNLLWKYSMFSYLCLSSTFPLLYESEKKEFCCWKDFLSLLPHPTKIFTFYPSPRCENGFWVILFRKHWSAPNNILLAATSFPRVHKICIKFFSASRCA